MAIGLRVGDVDSHLAGRVAFVGNADGLSASALAELSAAPGLAVPARPSDLFARGLEPLFRHYVAGRDFATGIAALCDDATFLGAMRSLADAVYDAALVRHRADTIVDASPSNSSVMELIRALYPEAAVLGGDAEAAALAAGPRSERARLRPDDAPRLAAPPVFVVGVARSGTTWLQHMLSAHPAIAGPAHETALFVRLRALRDSVSGSAAGGLAGWIDTPDLLAAMRRFAETLFAGYLAASGSGASTFLEKTPLHAEQLGLINEVFPDARIVSIHRDGRDVVRSLLEMEEATDDVVVAATRWAEVTREVTEALPMLRAARDERYEELLAQPVETVTGLLEWLGLEVDAAVVAEVERRSADRVSRYNGAGEPGAGKWRMLPARNIRAIYRFAGDRLVEAGYVTPQELRRERRRPMYLVDGAIRRLRPRY